MNYLQNITLLKKNKTRLFTAENVYGKKGAGGMAEVTDIPQPEVENLGQIWGGPNNAAIELGQKWKVRPCIDLASGTETNLMDVSAEGRITHIWITVDKKHFRELILRMYWDGEANPSVEAPLGDFFGCPWNRALEVVSLPINVNPTGGMNCYLPMPFRKHARVTIESLCKEQVKGFFYAISMDEGAVGADEAYFHASFNRTNPLKYGDDYVIAENIKGAGHFVGALLAWQQNNAGWWGEGEVKAFIDGDAEFPSYVGTGTEDYFGGAWCFNKNFSAPFLGYQDIMALDGKHTNQVGNRHAMYRFHIPDPIRFQSDFKMTIQAIGWRSGWRYLPLQDDLSSVAMWYQSEPHVKHKVLPCANDLEII
ncbi:MAG: DUF2961 domain-containing protein [Defluviitaleaceae bacterium]|nr:DUF2961 domain-containing protein [Defluviitaleaceae bacterium]